MILEIRISKNSSSSRLRGNLDSSSKDIIVPKLFSTSIHSSFFLTVSCGVKAFQAHGPQKSSSKVMLSAVLSSLPHRFCSMTSTIPLRTQVMCEIYVSYIARMTTKRKIGLKIILLLTAFLPFLRKEPNCKLIDLWSKYRLQIPCEMSHFFIPFTKFSEHRKKSILDLFFLAFPYGK